jgi:hypothetical protein
MLIQEPHSQLFCPAFSWKMSNVMFSVLINRPLLTLFLRIVTVCVSPTPVLFPIVTFWNGNRNSNYRGRYFLSLKRSYRLWGLTPSPVQWHWSGKPGTSCLSLTSLNLVPSLRVYSLTRLHCTHSGNLSFLKQALLLQRLNWMWLEFAAHWKRTRFPSWW